MTLRFWTILSVLVLILGQSYQATAQTSAVIQYPILIEPTHLNPFISNTISTNTVINNVFDGLTQTDPITGDILPAIADSWIIRTLDDGRQVFTFNIKQGLRYHQIDGVELLNPEVTADDIIWNYKLALNPNSDVSVKSSTLRFIDGADDYQAAFEGLGDSPPDVLNDVALRGVQVISDYTIQITLTAPDRLFLNEGMIGIISPEAYQLLGDDFNTTPVGTGPYQFSEWVAGDHILLSANPTYFNRDVPRNDGVNFIIYDDETAMLADYRAGEVDLLVNIPSDERQATIEEFSDEFFELEGLHVRYWGFNMATGFLSENLLVRQAFAHALDRETAWTVAAQGARFPANLGMLPPAMLASTPMQECIYDYNLERAADLLAEAGYPNGDGLPVIRIHLLEGIANEPQIDIWRDALESLGVEVELITLPSSDYWDAIREDDTMIFQNGWATGTLDPSSVFDFLILNGNGSMRYDNAVVNDLLREARIELDPDVRTPLYQQVHDIVMCDVVVIPSAYSRVSWLQKPWIEAFVPGGGGTHTAPLWAVIINR